MSYENEEKRNENNNRRIDIESNNPWITTTQEDLARQSDKISEHYIDNHLRGTPDGKYSNQMKEDLRAFYQTTDPTLVRYTLRKIAGSPKTNSAITDYTKSDEYFVTYKRD